MKMPLLASAQEAFCRKVKWLTYKEFLMQGNGEFKMKLRAQLTTEELVFYGSQMHN